MKKLSLIILSIFSIVVLSSCDKGELGPVANTTDPGAPEITSPESGESFTLTESEAKDTLMTMEWTQPDFGFTAAPTYSVQFAESGTEFAEPVEIASVQKTSLPIIVGEFNNKLIAEGFTANNTHSLDMRVVASISDSVSQAVAEPVTLSFTPYMVEVNYPKIWVPGDYQEASGYTANWSPADAPPLFSVEDDGTYEGYVYMANANALYKFTKEQNWDTNWGDTGGDGTLESGGDNIVASEAGYYKINVDLNNLTYTTLNTTWGVIGSATSDGWNSDQDMTYDPQTKVWSVTLDLTADEFKFRANNAWDLAYGDKNGDGKLDQEQDNNISVPEAGNYTIILDLSDAPYSYELNKN